MIRYIGAGENPTCKMLGPESTQSLYCTAELGVISAPAFGVLATCIKSKAEQGTWSEWPLFGTLCSVVVDICGPVSPHLLSCSELSHSSSQWFCEENLQLFTHVVSSASMGNLCLSAREPDIEAKSGRPGCIYLSAAFNSAVASSLPPSKLGETTGITLLSKWLSPGIISILLCIGWIL